MLRRTRIVGFVITLVFLALALWQIDLAGLGSAFSSANYLFVVPAALCTLASYLLRTVRWQRVLRPTRVVSFGGLFPVLMIGFMANNLLPARIGEFVRSYALGRKTGVSKSLGLATIFLERLLDGVTLVFLLAVVSRLMLLPEWGAELAYIASALFVVAGLGVVLLLIEDRFLPALVRHITRPLPVRFAARIASWADFFLVGLHAFRKKRVVILLLVYSGVIWLIEGCSYLLVLRAFNVQPEEGSSLLLAAFLTLVVVNLGILLPSAPGYVGTFQFFMILALGAVGVQRELALSASIVSHGTQYLLVTGIGLLSLWKENLSVRTLTGSDQRQAEPAPATVPAGTAAPRQ